jgi:CRP-like cAMP-binding protein
MINSQPASWFENKEPGNRSSNRLADQLHTYLPFNTSGGNILSFNFTFAHKTLTAECGSYNNNKMKNTLFDFIAKYITLTEEEKNALLSLDLFRSVRKGTVLLKEGQYSKDSFFVLKGCIRVYYQMDGEEKTTAFYTELDAVTPHCVINNAPSEYFISAVEDSILTVSNTDMEAEINSKFPKFETMCRILSAELLTRQQINFDEFKTASPEKRYLNLLEKRPDLVQRVPQHQLASYLGIKPQSLSRLRTRILEKKSYKRIS